MKKLYHLISVMLLFSTSGCSLIPEFELPSVELPSIWETANTTPSSKTPHSLTSKEKWWQAFGDPVLNATINTALNNNLELHSSLARIKQSRASLKSAKSPFLPSVSSSASASTSRSRSSGSISNSESLSAGLSVAYELDLFGSNQASFEAAESSLRSTEFSDDALRITVAADTADAYFTLLSLQERFLIENDNLDIAKQILQMVQDRYNVGRASAIELSQQKSTYSSAVSTYSSFEEQLVNAQRALAILLGKNPQAMHIDDRSILTIPIPKINAGIPSQLLQRRPDIAIAEESLIAANANIGAARAAFFPSISLSNAFSLSKAGLNASPSSSMSLASSLSAPIFSAGSLEASLEQSKARQEELISSYRQTILVALHEVENALTNVNTATTAYQQRQISLEEDMLTFSAAREQNKIGSTNAQNLLESKRTYLASRNSYIQSKQSQLTATISLIRTLGGGFNR